MWDFAGLPAPKSIIIPYLVSLSLPRGPFRVPKDQKLWPTKGSTETVEANRTGRLVKDFTTEVAAQLKNAGISFVRGWFQWNLFEPKIDPKDNGEFRFPLDDFVADMTEAGIRILGVVGNGYSRFLPEGLDLDNTTEYVNRLTKASQQIVRHYKDKIDIWQIENEPNWWAEHYSANWRKGGVWLKEGIQELILGALHDVVKAENPDAKVVVNLEADRRDTSWKSYSKFCDILGLDFYPNYSHSSPIDTTEIRLSEEVRKETGLPVFVAETGYPSGPLLFGYNESNQAEYVRRVCDESFSCDSINAICIWRYSDSYWHSFPDQENHFGLLTKEGVEKPAWNEYRNQIRLHGN